MKLLTLSQEEQIFDHALLTASRLRASGYIQAQVMDKYLFAVHPSLPNNPDFSEEQITTILQSKIHNTCMNALLTAHRYVSGQV